MESYNVNPINIKLEKFQGNQGYDNSDVNGSFFPALSRNNQHSNSQFTSSYDGSLANLKRDQSLNSMLSKQSKKKIEQKLIKTYNKLSNASTKTQHILGKRRLVQDILTNW